MHHNRFWPVIDHHTIIKDRKKIKRKNQKVMKSEESEKEEKRKSCLRHEPAAASKYGIKFVRPATTSSTSSSYTYIPNPKHIFN